MALELLAPGESIPVSPAARQPYLAEDLSRVLTTATPVPSSDQTSTRGLFLGWELMVNPELVYRAWEKERTWLNVIFKQVQGSVWSAQLKSLLPGGLLDFETAKPASFRNETAGEMVFVLGRSQDFRLGLEGVLEAETPTGWLVRPLRLYREQRRRSRRLSLTPNLAVDVIPFQKEPGQTAEKMYMENVSRGGARLRSVRPPAEDLLFTLPVEPGEAALVVRGTPRHMAVSADGYRFGVQWAAPIQKFETFHRWLAYQEFLQEIQGNTTQKQGVGERESPLLEAERVKSSRKGLQCASTGAILVS